MLKFKKYLTELYIRLFVQKKNTNKKQCAYFKNSTTKKAMNSSCTLSFTTETEKTKLKIHDELKPIVKKYINYPEKLKQYIRTQGIEIYTIKNADKLLDYVNEKSGFITPRKGFNALYINLLTSLMCERKINLSLSSKEIMIFDSSKKQIYEIIKAFYKYNCYKKSMPGFDYKSQEVFRKIYNQNQRKNNTSPFEGCSINDIYACKEAIARDIDSINFSIEIAREIENTKQAHDKLKAEKSAEI